MTGISTDQLPIKSAVDQLIGNLDGTTVSVPAAAIAAYLLTLQGPSYASLAELQADLDWPLNARGSVWSGSDAEIGVYRKRGAAGSGDWERIGDLPGASVTSALLATKADADAVAAMLDLARNTTQALDNASIGRWPGDDAALVLASNGAALLTQNSGLTRGHFSADDIEDGSQLAVLRAAEITQLRQDGALNRRWPGDEGQVVARAPNGVSAAFDRQGRLRGTVVAQGASWPGDRLTPLIEDVRGVMLAGIDAHGTLTEFAAPAQWPGDHILGLACDTAGKIVLGVDRRDGSIYPATAAAASAGTVQFAQPDTVGEAWQAVQDSAGVIRYLTRWQGEVLGLEQRDTLTLAQTRPVATGIVAIGGGDLGQPRTGREYPWHIFDETLTAPGATSAADGAAAAYLDHEAAADRARPTTVALAEVIGSTVEADVLPGTARRAALVERVSAAQAALAGIGKTLVVDRVKLSLLDGVPDTPEATADAHYAAIGNGIRQEVAEATGQAMLPVVVVNQGAGTANDGTSEVILAEGRLDWTHFALDFVVPTPLWPFEITAEGVLTSDAALLVSELEAHALAEKSAGREWFCPSLEAAEVVGSQITARFATMGPLNLRDPARHGFTLAGSSAAITEVSVAGSYATITLDQAPTGDFELRHAWGATTDHGDGYPANRGSLTDDWSAPSISIAGKTLYRHARSGRVAVTTSQ